MANPALPFGEEPNDDSFWLKVVSECLENPVTKLPQGKRLLVLGDNDSEKTLLISKLQGEARPNIVANFTKGNGLEYKYLTVKDEYGENHTKLGVWILDGDPFYKPLLKYVLDKDSLVDTTVVLVASMTKPWDIYETIMSWTEILQEHIESLGLSEEELNERKTKILERFREYIEPGLSIYGSLAADTTRELEVNLGIEIVVVITRTEYMKDLRIDFGYEEEHFDYLQFTLREFCLAHGAALFYVSVKEDRNCDFLLKYLLHKIYSFPFRIPGVLVEPDTVIVPAGWDTKNKIKFLSDGMPTIPTSTPFEDVVFKPARLYDTKRIKPEVVAQKDQDFLADLQAAMERQISEERTTASDVGKDNSSSMTATVVQRNVARRMTRAQPNKSPQKKIEAKIAEGDNTLSNFFHSLLNRRTSAPVDRPLGLSGGRTLIPKNVSDNATNPHTGQMPKHIPNTIVENISYKCNAQSIAESHNETSSEETAQKTLRKADQEHLVEHIEKDAEGNSINSRLKNTVHLSLDTDKDAHQLPEYFLSNAEDGCCSPGCSFPNSAASFDIDDQFSPPLDRVKSSFNPPLKLLLEKTEVVPSGKIKNGSALQPDDVLINPESVVSSLPCRLSNHDQNVLDEK